MGLEFFAFLVISIGLSYLAAKLLAPKQPKPNLDKRPTTTSERGTFIPWIKGRRRVGAVIGHVWDRYTRQESPPGGGGGKKGGGSDDPKVTIYYESAWHILAVGHGRSLRTVWKSGKKIWSGHLHTGNWPNGGYVDLGKEGGFYIYWGTQTSSDLSDAGLTYLNNQIGINSYWPKHFFVIWKPKRLGQSANWGDIQYEIEMRPQNHGVLTQTTATLGTGMNPAHCVAEMLFAPWPNGLGLDTDDWDLDSLEDVGTEAVEDNVFCSFMAADGQDVMGMMAAFLQDFGIMLPICQTSGKLKFVRIREPESVLQIPKEMIVKPIPEVITNHGERPIDQMVFMFPDRAHLYKDMTIAVPEDGQASYLEHARAKRISLETVVDFGPAAVLSERRGQEERAGGASVQFNANHGARTLEPGMAIAVHGIEPILRVSAVDVDPMSGAVKVSTIEDFYGAKKSDFVTNEGGGELSFQDPAESLAVGLAEVPEYLLGGLQKIVVMFMSIRAHADIYGAAIWIKLAADSSYTYIGDTRAAITGGELLAELSADDPSQHAQGPEIDDLGPDISILSDQSEVNWRLGRQIMVAGEEIMYLDEVTATGPNYRLDGILRARMGTKKETHAIGDPVFIFGYDALESFTDLIFSPGASVDIKIQPYSGSGAVDLATITPLNVTIHGRGITPLRVPGLRCVEPRHQVNVYQSGSAVKFRWGYMSSLSTGTGAGMQGYGTPVGNADVDGEFMLEIRNITDTTTVRTINTENLEYEYSDADLYADFGSSYPATFPVRISNLRNGHQSEYTQITVSKES